MTSGLADTRIEEMKDLLEAWTDKDLAAKLGVDPSTIAAWRRRNKVPEAQWLRTKSIASRLINDDIRRDNTDDQIDTQIYTVFLEFYEKHFDGRVLLKDEQLTRLWWGGRLVRFRQYVYAELRKNRARSTSQKLAYLEALRGKLLAERGLRAFFEIV